MYPRNFNKYIKTLRSNLKSVVGDCFQSIIMIPSAESIARTVKKERIVRNNEKLARKQLPGREMVGMQ